MQINLLIVSKLCSDVINSNLLETDTEFPNLNDLHDKIYDLYPTLNVTEYQLYWRYGEKTFHLISNYLSYVAAVTLMVDQTLFLLLNDCELGSEESEEFLKGLDLKELELIVQKNKDKYDVKILRKNEKKQEDAERISKEISTMSRTASQIITYAIRKFPEVKCFTADLVLKSNLITDLKKAMKGELISCNHKDIYFLETNTKSESTNLANLFASHGTGDPIKYKPSTKLKHKFNPSLDFFIQNKTEKASVQEQKTIETIGPETNKCDSRRNSKSNISKIRRSSIDLYEEAAAILGLTCSQTDSCRCIECQCHYFDFEEEIDFQSGNEYVVDHASSCSIQ